MKLLLECENVNPNSSDNDGRIPLSCPTTGVLEGVVELLSEASSFNCGSPETPHQMPTFITSDLLRTKK